MQQVSDPYRALGVARGATDAEIKAAHRKLAKRYHPDTEKGNTDRFLAVQEAYRVLSDPLLRKEWDARHAPGPVRANRPAAQAAQAAQGAQGASAARRRTPAGPKPQPKPANAEPSESAPPREPDPRTRPRSARAYTWSASEVPWWEDGGTRAEARQGRRRSRATDRAEDPRAAQQPGAASPDFDVYNRSSGAAWSMAARAYFRRGDADLPRRGSFHHQGTQPLTGARARTAAEAEARRRAAAPPPPAAAPPPPTAAAPPPPSAAAPRAAPQPNAAPRPAKPSTEGLRARDTVVRRSFAPLWPSLGQRLAFALLAWLPLAALAIYAGSVVENEEIGMLALMAIGLIVLVALPRLAYIGAVATLGLLVVGGLFVGFVALAGVRLPGSLGLPAAVGVVLAIGYIGTATMVVLGPAALRPWTGRRAQAVRSR